MAKLNGTWRFVSQDNLEGFHTAKKTPDAYKEFLRGLGQAVKSNPDAYKELLAIDAGAGTATRTAFINDEKKREMSVKVGVETEVTLADGRTAKSSPSTVTSAGILKGFYCWPQGTVEIHGDSKAVLHEKGDGFESSAVYEVNEKELTVTQTCAGQTAVMKFTKV